MADTRTDCGLPEQRCLTRFETRESLWEWRRAVVSYLTSYSGFEQFVNTTWSRVSPLRGQKRDSERTAEQKVALLELMLCHIAALCPIIARRAFTKNSTSLSDIWRTIAIHFGVDSFSESIEEGKEKEKVVIPYRCDYNREEDGEEQEGDKLVTTSTCGYCREDGEEQEGEKVVTPGPCGYSKEDGEEQEEEKVVTPSPCDYCWEDGEEQEGEKVVTPGPCDYGWEDGAEQEGEQVVTRSPWGYHTEEQEQEEKEVSRWGYVSAKQHGDISMSEPVRVSGDTGNDRKVETKDEERVLSPYPWSYIYSQQPGHSCVRKLMSGYGWRDSVNSELEGSYQPLLPGWESVGSYPFSQETVAAHQSFTLDTSYSYDTLARGTAIPDIHTALPDSHKTPQGRLYPKVVFDISPSKLASSIEQMSCTQLRDCCQSPGRPPDLAVENSRDVLPWLPGMSQATTECSDRPVMYSQLDCLVQSPLGRPLRLLDHKGTRDI